jgi:hypothetical protein
MLKFLPFAVAAAICCQRVPGVVQAFVVPLASSTTRAAMQRLLPLHMFTGIVEEMGVVQSLVERDDMVLWDGSQGHGTELTVKGNVVMEGAYLG